MRIILPFFVFILSACSKMTCKMTPYNETDMGSVNAVNDNEASSFISPDHQHSADIRNLDDFSANVMILANQKIVSKLHVGLPVTNAKWITEYILMLNCHFAHNSVCGIVYYSQTQRSWKYKSLVPNYQYFSGEIEAYETNSNAFFVQYITEKNRPGDPADEIQEYKRCSISYDLEADDTCYKIKTISADDWNK